MPAVVTGYIPLPCAHRSDADYRALGNRLQAVCEVPTVTFTSCLEDCWMYKDLVWRGYDVQPGGKDTLAYYCVQHEKTQWLAAAERAMPDGTLVWIDYGIFHLPGVTSEHVNAFLRAIDTNPPRVITSPSCYEADSVRSGPNWTFCGGVLVVPATLARWFHLECMAEQRRHQPTWEVNTWAAVRRNYPDRFSLYRADHNATLFTGYRCSP